MSENSDTSKKVAVVTGASSGIGQQTVLDLIEKGFLVYAAARRVESMKDLEVRGARVKYVDLTSQESIDLFSKDVLDEAKRIDVLVNNAGYGSYGAIEDVSIEEARRQFEVNLFGLARLIQNFLPQMRAQRSGRIINISSIGGKVWSLLGGWYHATKFALEGFSDCLRNEVKPFGIHVVIIEPGSIKTEWSQIAVDNMQKAGATSPYRPLIDRASRFFLRFPARFGAHPQIISKLIVEASIARKPKIRYVGPRAGKIALVLRWLLPDSWFDHMLSRVFKVPEKL